MASRAASRGTVTDRRSAPPADVRCAERHFDAERRRSELALRLLAARTIHATLPRVALYEGETGPVDRERSRSRCSISAGVEQRGGTNSPRRRCRGPTRTPRSVVGPRCPTSPAARMSCVSTGSDHLLEPPPSATTVRPAGTSPVTYFPVDGHSADSTRPRLHSRGLTSAIALRASDVIQGVGHLLFDPPTRCPPMFLRGRGDSPPCFERAP